MGGHLHTDIVHISVFALGTLLFAHFLRMTGAYLAGHGMGNIGVPLGAFATLGR